MMAGGETADRTTQPHPTTIMDQVPTPKTAKAAKRVSVLGHSKLRVLNMLFMASQLGKTFDLEALYEAITSVPMSNPVFQQTLQHLVTSGLLTDEAATPADTLARKVRTGSWSIVKSTRVQLTEKATCWLFAMAEVPQPVPHTTWVIPPVAPPHQGFDFGDDEDDGQD